MYFGARFNKIFVKEKAIKLLDHVNETHYLKKSSIFMGYLDPNRFVPLNVLKIGFT